MSSCRVGARAAHEQATIAPLLELMVGFQTNPDKYRHWQLSIDGSVATLTLDVDEHSGIDAGYELKLNSYDLGVDIELSDAVQRLRFEHPEVGAVTIMSNKDRVFCAGANIRMLGQASHPKKVNFCKFTNETRLAIEDASAHSGQKYLCAINGTAAGGGYELALATDYIMMVDDGATAVSLPELPLLAVLPGTGGLTRLVDKRKVRRDHADFFCTVEEGVRGARAVQWRLVDEVVPTSQFPRAVKDKASEMASSSERPQDTQGIRLETITRDLGDTHVRYDYLQAEIDRTQGIAHTTLLSPVMDPPRDTAELVRTGADFWPLALARELDDLILHLRHNELEIGSLVFRSRGDIERVSAFDAFLIEHLDHWLVREVTLYWKRILKRLEVTSRSIFTLVEPGSCFAGFLLEIVLAADRSYMLNGQFEDDDLPAPRVRLTDTNFGLLPTINGLSRLASRHLDDTEGLDSARQQIGRDLDARGAEGHGLVTFTPDDIDWDDEVRFALEERASFSPDALIGMEACLRTPGPETLESKIFGRLSAWQNWIFQRPNAIGDTGALSRYGTGVRAEYDKRRV